MDLRLAVREDQDFQVKVMLAQVTLGHLAVVVAVQLALDQDCKAVLEHLHQLLVFQLLIAVVAVVVDMMALLVDLAVLVVEVLAVLLLEVVAA